MVAVSRPHDVLAPIDLRVWSNGMTRAFQALDVGSIPTIRSQDLALVRGHGGWATSLKWWHAAA